MNKVLLAGNLGADPEIRHAASGTEIANLRLATRGWDGQKEVTEWHRVVCFGKTAAFAGEYLRKGSAVTVEGRIQTRKWEKDGQTRYSTEIVADRVNFAPKSSDGPREQPQAQPQAQAADDFDDIPFMRLPSDGTV